MATLCLVCINGFVAKSSIVYCNDWIELIYNAVDVNKAQYRNHNFAKHLLSTVCCIIGHTTYCICSYNNCIYVTADM